MAFVLPNSVFLHCPKTAGHWVRKVLSNAGVPFTALPWHTHSSNLPDEHSGKFRFTFVRHPLTWYQSFFAHKCVNGWCHDEIDRHCRSSDFQQFVENALEHYPDGYCSTVLCERYFEGADFVGRFERLKPDLIRAMGLAGERFDRSVTESLHPENTSNYQLIDVGYSMELRERVVDVERGIIDRYYR